MSLQLLVTFVSKEQSNFWSLHAWLDCLLLLFLNGPLLSFMVQNGYLVLLIVFPLHSLLDFTSFSFMHSVRHSSYSFLEALKTPL